MKRRLLIICLLVFKISLLSYAQTFQLNGNASIVSPGVYQLTPAQDSKKGSMWNTTLADLTASFTILFQLNFGNDGDGGDGMTFAFQTEGTTAIGNDGSDLGYGGLPGPSIAIEFDDFWFSGDPNEIENDHLAVNVNGGMIPAPGTTPIIARLGIENNIEDGNYHRVRISWDALNQKLYAYFDDRLRIIYESDLITDVFGNEQLVYWGFTGGTGGIFNDQRVSNIQFYPSSGLDFTLNGDALDAGLGKFILTPDEADKIGSIWNNQLIDLSLPFTINFLAYFGSTDNDGADGITFALQNSGTNSIGNGGSDLGYGNIGPSIAVEFDNFSSGFNDISEDHIAIDLDGNLAPASGTSAVTSRASAPFNIEDAALHAIKITWDAVAKVLSVYFDNNLRITYTKNLVSDIFGNDPMVYWGFTGSTGSLSNEQSISDIAFANALVLPVTLTDFHAKITEKAVALSWKTFSETNNKGFEIQRSRNGVHFDFIGFVAAREIAGGANYQFIDRLPFTSKNYYRLKQIDINNAAKFSSVCRVDFSNAGYVNLYPNPAKDVLHVNTSYTFNKAQLTIRNMNGQLLKKESVSGVGTIRISIKDLPAGVYNAEITDPLKSIKLVFVKQ